MMKVLNKIYRSKSGLQFGATARASRSLLGIGEDERTTSNNAESLICRGMRMPFVATQQAGMSLIEIMIVFGLIAGLMAFLISNFSQKADMAKVDQAKIGIGTIQSALQLYRVHNGKYPTTDQGLKALLASPGDVKSWRGPYTEENKLKDPWNNDYSYESDGKNIKIISGGIDGTVGNEDDIIYPEPSSK